MQRVSHLLGTVLILAAMASPSSAGQRRHVDATPFAHAPCSVLDNRPCTPTVCSPLNHGPCIPEIDYPVGQDLHLTIESRPAETESEKYNKPDHDLNTIGDLFAALRACWTPPDADVAFDGMEMSVRFSIKRNGGLIAPSRITYATPNASSRTRDIYRHAIDDALSHCMPLTLTPGLAGAIAGRPIMVRYVDNRSRDQVNPGTSIDHP